MFFAAITEARALREENRTLYRVIKLVSSSLEVGPMLQGIVDLTTEATDCHACFIYLREGRRLTMRAASPIYADAVGKVQMGLGEGLTGWVARHRTPEFIPEHAMSDPRMKYVPEEQCGRSWMSPTSWSPRSARAVSGSECCASGPGRGARSPSKARK